MPTSLVSTGVQFPDSTTQTTALPAPGTNGNVLTSNGTTWQSTAPSGAGGATQVGSIVIGNTKNFQILSANPSATIAAPFFSTTNGISYPVSSAQTYYPYAAPIWSTYYNGWFTLAPTANSVGSIYVFYSPNGISWQPFYYAGTVFNAVNATAALVDGRANIAVDETNGRLFISFQDYSTYVNGVYYTPAPALPTSSTISWTRLDIDTTGAGYYSAAYPNNMQYVNIGGNSRLIFVSGRSYNGTVAVYAMTPGTLTFTNVSTFTPSGGSASTTQLAWNPTMQRAAIACYNWSSIAYTPTANNLTSWTTVGIGGTTKATQGSDGYIALSATRVAVLSHSGGIRYSSDFSTFTHFTGEPASALYSIAHNGTNWLGLCVDTDVSRAGLWSSSSADPTSWTYRIAGAYSRSPFAMRQV